MCDHSSVPATAGGEVGGIRQRRHYVAKERAGADGADGPVVRNAEGVANAEHGQADRAEGAPGGAGGQRDDGGQNAGRRQEDARADDVEAEFQHGLDGAGGDGGGNHHAYAKNDDGGRQRHFHHAVHVFFHLRPLTPLQRHEDTGDANADNQRNVRGVVLEDKELLHEDDHGDGQRCDFKAEGIVAAVFV